MKLQKKTVIVIVGMPGAGKSLASTAGKQLNIPVFVSGDVIRLEARRRGLKPTRKSLGDLMVRIRREEGMGAVAKRLTPIIRKLDKSLIIYEGARNMEEVQELARTHKVVTIAIHASTRTRFHRLIRRQRSDRPHNWNEFLERDNRELKIGVANTIALSDYMIVNETAKRDLTRQVSQVLASLAH